MKWYQIAAFGTLLVLAVALAIVWTYDLNTLVYALVLVGIVALLTLAITWKIIMSAVQLVGVAIGGLGHGVGYVGDTTSLRAKQFKARLSEKRTESRHVPDWDELETIETSPSGSGSTAASSFMDDVLERQNT